MALAPPERCEECGFEAASVTPVDAAETIRAFGRRYRAPLSRFLPGEDGQALVRRRPDATTWSALEYAAHMRDVLALWGWALNKALTEDRVVVIGEEEMSSLAIVHKLAHEGHHHLLDIGRVLRTVRGR